MKRQLFCFFAVMAFTAAFTAYVAPVRTMIIPLAHQPFVIDGVDDDSQYSAWQSTEAFNPTGSTGADADYTFTFKLAYDATYLFVFAKILDDYSNCIDSIGQDSAWMFDNVELFVDLDTNGSGNNPSYDSNTYQVRFNRGIDSVGNDFGRSGQVNRWDHKYYWENTADGWQFEAALAWKFVLGPGQKTEDILRYANRTVVSGFDMSGADSDFDGAGYRDCQTAWDNDDPQDVTDRTEDNAWKNRTVFGTINFEVYCCGPPDGIISNVDSKSVVYPNPVNDFISFSNLRDQTLVTIMTLTGQVVLTSNIINNQIDLSQLADGVYLAKVGYDMIKIIKQ